jgi:tyrosine-protein kinase Etk/Wzc
MLGVALALGAGLGVEYFDTSVHSPRDLERRGFTVLASIPALTDRKLRLAAGSAIGRVASHLVSSTDSGSSAAEAFRMLRTSLQFTIVITSPGPGEGKSTVATNLATVLAQSGHRTLLLDADLRRPVLHSVFHRRKKPGFTDMVLLGNPDRDAIFPTGIEDLFCLPCGTIPPGPADVLNSSATDALLNRLSADYEYVVIDSPPVLVAADTAILTAKADATILVVRAGKTSTEAIEHARQVLHQAGARVAGFVVNGIKHSGRYGRDSYYYYKYRYTREPQNQRRPSWLRNGPSTDPDPSPCPPTPDPGSSATGCPGPA